MVLKFINMIIKLIKHFQPGLIQIFSIGILTVYNFQ